MCLRESTSPMTASFFLYACIFASSSSVAICSSSGFLYVAAHRKKKKKTDYMLMDTRSRLSVPHMPKICPSFYYPVVKQNEQNPSTEFDIRPHHLTGPHSTCEITTNCCRWIYSLISSSHRRAHWGHEQPDLCGNTRTSTLLKLEGVTVGSLHCIVLIYLPTQ